MPNSALKRFQNHLKTKLQNIFPIVEVEWIALREQNIIYSPRIDLAIGPFATRVCKIDEYDRIMRSKCKFFNILLKHHLSNIRSSDSYGFDGELDFNTLLHQNTNARCLAAIEIENEVSRKHLIGGAVNASALGRVGIIIGWTPEKHRALIKLRKYLLFLKSVGKNTFKTTNLLIITKNQMLNTIEEYLEN
jgi:hypothetical protein